MADIYLIKYKRVEYYFCPSLLVPLPLYFPHTTQQGANVVQLISQTSVSAAKIAHAEVTQEKILKYLSPRQKG